MTDSRPPDDSKGRYDQDTVTLPRPAPADREVSPAASPSIETLRERPGRPGDRPAVLPDTILPRVPPTHFELGTELARGGLGRIVNARDTRLDRPVVVKQLLPRDRLSIVRFEREAHLTARLQHPGIVPVYEAGALDPTGAPFYVMRRIDGRSLEEVLQRTTTVAERIALVPALLAATEAVAYAHSRQVVHRDLKPANILVGDFGETVVVDWGLAKELGQPSLVEVPEDAPALAADASEPEVGPITMAGMVLGTPGYLSPEQARGLPVDERADVYALGATLYHVLSGHAPVVGEHLHDVLERTGRGDIVPLAEANPGLPSDLCAIVHKALSLAPGDRYPTARELAEDLRRFQTGRLVGAHAYRPRELVRRWLARHRAVVAVSGAALAILVVTGVLALRGIVKARQRAEQERSRAVKQRDAAEVLVDFMLGDLKERLEQVGRLAFLEGVGAEVDLYYQRLSPDPDRLDAPGRARQARARRILAQVLGERGEVTLALDHLSRVRRVEEALLAHRPGAAAHGNLARTLVLVGTLALRAGHKEAAQQALGEAVRLAREALRLEPGSDRWRSLAIQALLARGRQLLHASDLGPALQAGREALTLAEAQRAGSTHRDEELGDVHGALSATLALQGNLDAALLSAEASAAALDRVRVRDPGNARLERRVVSALYNLCQAAVEAGAASRAEAPCRRLNVLAGQLLHRDPTSAQGLRLHALSRYWASWAEHLLGRSDRALTRAEEARAALLELVAKDRRDVEFAQNAAGATQLLAELRLEQGDPARARELSEQILASVRELSARSPDLFRWAEATLGARAVLAAAWLAGGDPARALVEATVALAEASRAPPALARATDGARSLVLVSVTAARAHLARGDLALAEQRAREAIATSRSAPLALRSRLEPEGQAALSEALARKGDAPGALAAARERARLARENVGRYPGNVPELLAAARAVAALAGLERQRAGGEALALALGREARELLERAARTPGLVLSPADQALQAELRRVAP